MLKVIRAQKETARNAKTNKQLAKRAAGGRARNKKSQSNTPALFN